MRIWQIIILAASLMAAPLGIPSARAEAVLLMFEQDGCYWCGRWDDEIAHIYPKTEEGRIAPLRRIDIDDDLPDGIDVTPRPVFTPTFVLIDDGHEVYRIEGYPGEDFFWGLLGRAIETEITQGGS